MERALILARHLAPLQPVAPCSLSSEPVSAAAAAAKDDPRNAYVTIIDQRTGKTINVPIHEGTIRAEALRELGLFSYDPSLGATATVTSSISFIDGDEGILRYRGYPIEELAEKSNFLETAFLVIHGALPTAAQLRDWQHNVMSHTYLHENHTKLMDSFRYDAHPMGMIISCVAALSTFYPEANPAVAGSGVFDNPRMRNKQIYRLLGKLPTIAAAAYRHRIGRPYNHPISTLGYTENFLYMLDALNDTSYRPHPRLVRALDVLFILHMEHEMNCSTAAMRHITSSRADPYVGVAGAAAALFGPLHGGANEAVLHMLERIGDVAHVPQFLDDVKARKELLFGFGHRVYKNYDPRAKLIRQVAYEVFDLVGKEPLIDVAIALETAALKDDYFVSRKLYPNVDFYSGLIYKAMGFPTDMFPVLFLLPRAVGWLAHWLESLSDKEQKIARPRQIYDGPDVRHVVPMHARPTATINRLDAYHSTFQRTAFNKRRAVSTGESYIPNPK